MGRSPRSLPLLSAFVEDFLAYFFDQSVKVVLGHIGFFEALSNRRQNLTVRPPRENLCLNRASRALRAEEQAWMPALPGLLRAAGSYEAERVRQGASTFDTSLVHSCNRWL